MQEKNNNPKWLGVKFGRIKIIGFIHKPAPYRGWNWEVQCDCGNVKIVYPSDVKSGKVKSCGCYHSECSRKRAGKYIHKVYENKRLYGIYNGIKKRCRNQRDLRYKDYGGRGIKVCSEWLDSFDNFVEWAIANGYEESLTIERKDVDGNYCSENCCWISIEEQAKNTRKTKFVKYRGDVVLLTELSKISCVSYDTLHDRIFKRGWSVEKAAETLSQTETSFTAKCKQAGISPGTARDRIVKLGWSEEDAINTPTHGRGSNVSTYGRDSGFGICAVCGVEFHKNNGKQIYCGAKCRNKGKSK